MSESPGRIKKKNSHFPFLSKVPATPNSPHAQKLVGVTFSKKVGLQLDQCKIQVPPLDTPFLLLCLTAAMPDMGQDVPWAQSTKML